MFAVIAFLAAAAIQTAVELGRATERYEPAGRAFDITVRITQPPHITRGSFYAEDGVKRHVNAIMVKLGADSRAEAVTIALRKHLLKIYPEILGALCQVV